MCTAAWDLFLRYCSKIYLSRLTGQLGLISSQELGCLYATFNWTLTIHSFFIESSTICHPSVCLGLHVYYFFSCDNSTRKQSPVLIKVLQSKSHGSNIVFMLIKCKQSGPGQLRYTVNIKPSQMLLSSLNLFQQNVRDVFFTIRNICV